ncbi:unnamed protein product [Dimorphilus gyrociliatus]|uniref:BRCT domain-containing protein n=1 Tax=Dimorphilus gyrociliatus TaxID=2664684 RepID=A0A7I8W1A2_9ANNE|nr:unnamed protein product [Dimorphilus gyrociliatus]
MSNLTSVDNKSVITVDKFFFFGKKTSLMERAFEIARKVNIEVSWTDDVNDEMKIYVCERILDNPLLKDISPNTCILGPCYVLQICRKNLPPTIPLGTRRIANVLSECLICFTSIPRKERENYKEKVKLMNGEVSGDFHEGITHLVAAEAGSRKFIVASYLNKSIMTFSWLDSIWKDCHEQPSINIEDYQHLVCPLFAGLTICVSGYGSSVRSMVKTKVEELGGNFSGSMQQASCTHLIVNQPGGQKYEYAVRWQIPIVNLDWLNDCYDKKQARDENQYKVVSNTSSARKTSTPNTSTTNFSGPEVSMVSNVSSIQDTILDITNFKSGDYLDGCVILLHGFNADSLLNLKKLINVCGAVRVNIYSDSVTHVVVGSANDAKDYENKNAVVVSQQWLIDCAKDRKMLRTSEYTFANKNDSLNKTHSKTTTETPKAAQCLETTGVHGENIENADLYSQYMGDSTMEKVAADIEKENMRGNEKTTFIEEENSHSNQTSETTDQVTTNDESFEVSQQNNTIFANLKFKVNENLDDREVFSAVIQENKGEVVDENPDYLIVPNEGTYEVSSGKVVTETWIKLCLERNSLVKPSFICKPLPYAHGEPLKKCVLCFSGFQGEERQSLIRIATALGACVQEQLCRKNRKELLATTHLILVEASGPKFEAARRWKRHALKISWLKACFVNLERVSEEEYDIETFDDGEISDEQEKEDIDETEDIPPQPSLPTKPDYIDSPSVFLNPDKSFKPRITIDEGLLKSTPNERKRPRQSGDLMEECSKGIEAALKHSKEKASPRGMTPAIKRKKISPLDGVVIGVSTKLADKQTRLNELADKLGAEYRWDVDDERITHLVCDKILKSELDSEISLGRKVVTANWLDSCAENNKLLDEENFLPKLIRESSAEDEKIESDIQALMELDDNRMNLDVPSKGSFCGLASFTQTQQTESQSQRGDVRWHDEPSQQSDFVHAEKKVFILSGFNDNDRLAATEMIISFKNCEILKSNGYDDSCTHMVCKTLIRNEKILSAIAAGKWILKPEYISSSYEHNQWLPEESYEWANSFKADISTGNPQTEQLAKWSRHWRIKIKAGEPLPFQSWTVGILANRDKVEGFRKILASGGATIAFLKDPKVAAKKVSHCFVDGSKKNDKKLLNSIRAETILKTDYIVSYLMGNYNPDSHKISL